MSTVRRTSRHHTFEEDFEWLEDMPSGGALAKYRASASFSWKQLRIILEGSDKLRLKVNCKAYRISENLCVIYLVILQKQFIIYFIM